MECGVVIEVGVESGGDDPWKAERENRGEQSSSRR